MDEISLTEFEMIGQLHNEGLSYMFDRIKNQPATRSGGRDVFDKNILLEYMNGFLESKGATPLQTLEKIPIPVILFQTTRTKGVFEGWELSEKENYYFQILIHLGTELSSLDDVNNAIKELEKIIILDESLTNEETERLLIGFVVSRYSFEYWLENLMDWAELINGDRPETRGFWGDLWDAAWKTGVTDGGGAVIGAIAGGAGALPGAIGASFMYCLNELI